MGGRSSKEKEQRKELMRYVGPTGLYSPGIWDVGAHAGTVKRLILARKLAPRYPGQEDKKDENHEVREPRRPDAPCRRARRARRRNAPNAPISAIFS